MMRCIDEIPASELAGKKVLVRAGLDLSVNERGEVTDTFRVRKAIPTLEYLKKSGARVVILSHIGRDPEATNALVAQSLKHFLQVTYVPDLLGHAAQSALEVMKDGDVVLLENLRQHYDLEKEKDATFANELAALGDLYVNDAFSNSHRDHASMTVVPTILPSYMGLLLRDEVRHLTAALTPTHPAIAIIGGAKFETKDPVIKLFLQNYDRVCVVGALANDFLKVKGFPMGRSLVSEHAPTADTVNDPRILTSIDVTVEQEDAQVRVKKPDAVEGGDKIVDIGPDTHALFAQYITKAQFIIWNGPTGIYEEGYTHWTHAIGSLIQKRVTEGAAVVIGGGDTIAALQDSGIPESELGFLSTGGGAMLEFLVKGSLPALDALAQ